MRFLTTLIVWIISLQVSAGSLDGTTPIHECIIEGSQVQLMGRLISITFPIDPKHLPSSAAPGVYWILKTEKSYCGEGYDPKTKVLSRLQESCSRFQLMLSPDQYSSHRELLGKHVVVKGKIVMAKTELEQNVMAIDVNEIALESD